MTRASVSRTLLVLALIFLSVSATPSLWAQENEWSKLMKAGDKADESLNFAKAEKKFQAALAQTQTSPAADLRTAETLGRLARVFTREKKFAEAEDLWKRAATITEAAAGPDDPRLAYALISLALVYESENKPEEAARLWNRPVAILEKAGGPVDPKVLMAMQGVALSALMHGRDAGAEHIYWATLELRESLGASDQDLKFALRHMALVYERTGRDSEAEPLEIRMLKMDEKDFGPESWQTGGDLEALADLYMRERRYATALPLLQRRLAISLKLAPPPDSGLDRTYKGMAYAWDAVALVPDLLLHGMEVLPLIGLGRPDNFSLMRAYRSLAKGYAGAGKYHEAEDMYKQVIAIDENKATSHRMYLSMNLADDLRDLCIVYRDDHRYDEALDAIKRSENVDQKIAESKWEKSPGGKSLLLWHSEIELAEIYREKGNTAAAEPVFQRSLEAAQNMVAQKRLVPHLKLAQLLDHYATLLRDEGNYGQAESLYKRALDTWAESAHPVHPDVAETLANYAALLRKLDRGAEAEPLEARASAIRAKIGASDPLK